MKEPTLTEKIKLSIECHKIIKELKQFKLGWIFKFIPFEKHLNKLDEHIKEERNGIK